jgi:hypothetical protein
MESLFSPCTRLRDEIERRGRRHGVELRQVNLNVSTEELLSAERALTYADLYAMLGNGEIVAWLTPHATVVPVVGRAMDLWPQLNNSCRFRFHFNVNGNGNEIVAFALSHEHLVEICDVVLRLLAASVVHSVHLNRSYYRNAGAALINAPTLAYLMEQCQSLKSLVLENLEMDEHHCRVLGAYSGSGLKIELIRCKLTSAGARALAEVLGRNRGPTKLDYCDIDFFVLANGLRGNSRLKSFRRGFSDNSSVVAIAAALRENQGLVELELRSSRFNMNDEAWGALCDSLKTHPTLEVLDLLHGIPPITADVITSRTQALVEMIKVNTSIHTLRVNSCYRGHDIYRGSVIPYLEMNRFRPRVLAIQKARPIVYRAKVLGRALLAVRTDPNRFCMLLSENAEVAFSSTRTATTTPAANLPTPATTNAATNANAAPIVAAAAAAATTRRAASIAGASTTVNVNSPSASQKRKARP